MRLSPNAKYGFMFILFAATVILGKIYWYDKKHPEEAKAAETKAALGDAKIYKVGVVFWPGYVGGQWFNHGFKANAESEFFKRWGFGVEFVIINDIGPSREAFKSGEIDLLWCTVDALPTEMDEGSGLAKQEAKFRFQTDWSRGGDAIVVGKNIQSVADLKGKTIAVAEMSPSHSFLINLLASGGLTMNDVTLVKVDNAGIAASLFQTGKSDAAIVWSPDDVVCVATIPGAHVLQSTKTASHIISDGFLIKQEVVDNNTDDITHLIEGWLEGNGKINTDAKARKEAIKILADGLQISQKDAEKALGKVRLTTYGDNMQFFGETEGGVVTAPQLYTKMAAIYSELGYVSNPLPWRTVGDATLLTNIHSLTGVANAPEPNAKFTVPTKAMENVKAVATKSATINFPKGVFTLDGVSRDIIDREFSDEARHFSNARIRIQGNTDKLGSAAFNRALSFKRANAVKEYLIKSYHFDENRFIIVGNGPDKPVCTDDNEACYQQNRRTDFELIGEE